MSTRRGTRGTDGALIRGTNAVRTLCGSTLERPLYQDYHCCCHSSCDAGDDIKAHSCRSRAIRPPMSALADSSPAMPQHHEHRVSIWEKTHQLVDNHLVSPRPRFLIEFALTGLMVPVALSLYCSNGHPISVANLPHRGLEVFDQTECRSKLSSVLWLERIIAPV